MKSRLVRVFISSTFRDFIQERDELVKKVFPELRRRCKERFVELLEVDLRWGITEEQAKGGETLRICLEEIDRCRPSAPVFFVGLLGERYGWIPPKEFFTKEVLEDPNLDWVKEHIEGKSVTELEILHGVLRNEAMRDKAFFYFRNDGYQDRHWQDIESHHQKISPSVTKQDFTNAKSEHRQASDDQKQRELKQAIRDASLAWDPRNYETPEEMGRIVLEDLWSAIDRVFPVGEVPDENERHRLEHDAFGQSRTKGYVNRAGLFEKLGSVLSEKGSPVVAVTGESGGGKSALLAAWLEQLGASAPSRRFVHYIGGTPESSSAKSIVFRLMNQIRSWGAVSDPIPEDFGQAVEALPEWLALAATGQERGVLLVLDALNQLELSRDRSLWWLPKQLPVGVRLVVSTLPGESEDELRARGWLENELKVPPLNDRESKQIINGYLGRFTKKLDNKLVERLALAPQAANPLFLRVVLDELRIRARHEELGQMLEKMLEAEDPSELFIQVLKNLEEFDKERKDLVREAMGYLAVSRRGLSEDELLQLLSEDSQPSSNPLPRHYWSPLYLALEDSLVSRNGQLSFFHDYLRQAAETEYLDEERERKKVHSRLGDVAEAWNSDVFSPSLRSYGLAHGAWHLSEAKESARLWRLLSGPKYADAQHREFGRLDETVSAYELAVSSFASLQGRGKDDDPRLAWLLLRCGEIVREARSGVRGVFAEFRRGPLGDTARVSDAIEKIQLLDNERFYQAMQLLLAAEIELCRQAQKPLSATRLQLLADASRNKVPRGTQVPVVAAFETLLAESLPPEIYKGLAELTFEAEWRAAFLVGALAKKGMFDTAVDTAALISEELDRCRAIGLIADAARKSDMPQNGKNSVVTKLIETLDTFSHRPDRDRAALAILPLFLQDTSSAVAIDSFEDAVDLAETLASESDRATAYATIAAQHASIGQHVLAKKFSSLAAQTARSLEHLDKRDAALVATIRALGPAQLTDDLVTLIDEINNIDTKINAITELLLTSRQLGNSDMSSTLLRKGQSLLPLGIRPSVCARFAAAVAPLGDVATVSAALSSAREGALEQREPYVELLFCAEALANSSLSADCSDFVVSALENIGAETNPLHSAQYLSHAVGSMVSFGQFELAERLNSRVEAEIERIGERVWRSRAWYIHSDNLASSEDMQRSEDAFARGIEAASAIDDDAADLPKIFADLALSAMKGGKNDTARRLLQQAAEEARKVEDSKWRDRAFANIAKHAARMDELEFALAVAGEITTDLWISRTIEQITPHLTSARGRAGIRRNLASVVGLCELISSPEQRVSALAEIVKAKILVGDRPGAEKAAQRIADALESEAGDATEVRMTCVYARSLASMGQDDDTLAQLENALLIAEQLDCDESHKPATGRVLACLGELGYLDAAVGKARELLEVSAVSSSTLAGLACSLGKQGRHKEAGELLDAASKAARSFNDHVAILREFAELDLARALSLANATDDAARRCEAVLACLGARGTWSPDFEPLPHFQQVFADIGKFDVLDQSDWLGIAVGVLLRRNIPWQKSWRELFANAAKSDRAYDFLLPLEFQDHDPALVLPWIRGFMCLCPRRKVIGKKLVYDLISAHLRSTNPRKAESVAKACAQLGLPREMLRV